MAAAAAARAFDRRLLDSLRYLSEVAADRAGIVVPGLDRLEAALDRGLAASPALHGAHYDLVEAIDGDDTGRVASVCAIIDALEPIDGRRVVPLNAGAVGEPIVDIYRRNLDADPAQRSDLRAPAPDAFARAETRVAEALALIDTALPPLRAEIDAVLREIMVVGDGPGAVAPFYAASSFYIWGGIGLAPRNHRSVHDLAETLVHEAAHLLLYLLTADEPAARNPKAARYRSPLRADPRPMDGVIHAVFVIAREIMLDRALAAASTVAGDIRSAAREAAASKELIFRAGLETVRRDAALTETGRALIDDASAYVDGDR